MLGYGVFALITFPLQGGVVAKMSTTRYREKFIRFEADYGDLQSALSVEQRCREAREQPGTCEA